MADPRIYLFGTPQITVGGVEAKVERRKALALAAYLALTRGRQSRDVIAALLWPDFDEAHARSSLRTATRALAAAAPGAWIEGDRTTVALNRDAVWVDVGEFTALLDETGTHGHGPDTVCDACVPLLKQAAALYRADFLDGFYLSDNAEFERWQLGQREWLRREYADALRRLTYFYADQRQYHAAIDYARQWLASDPLNEMAHRQLMRLYAANGQRSEALRQYKQCAELLETELATPPERETTALYEAIQHDRLEPEAPALAQPSSVVGVMPSLPPLLIGREDALAEIKRRIGIGGGSRGTLIIQGWPGVGKSTIVAALAHDADVATQYPDGVLWASLGETPDLSAELATWADALRLSEPGRVRRAEEISAQMRAVLRDKRMLMIVDDVWQPEHAVPFRVGGQACALVMTSRLNDVAGALAPTAADIYRLPVLSEAASLQLLASVAPEVVEQRPDEARELVRDLEGLPLAIHVAGRLLHSESRLGWGVRELLDELRSGAALLQAKAPDEMHGVVRDSSPTIAALLKRSTDLLDPAMRRLFAYLGLFVPKPATFDLEAMGVAWDVNDPRPVVRTLVNRGLLEPISGGRFQMHALLVMHARSLLEGEESAQ